MLRKTSLNEKNMSIQFDHFDFRKDSEIQLKCRKEIPPRSIVKILQPTIIPLETLRTYINL